MSEEHKTGPKPGQSVETAQNSQNQLQNTENVALEKRQYLLEDYISPDECPESLKNILKFLDSRNTLTKIDILAGLLYLFMAEYGFVPINYESDTDTFEFNLPRVLALSENLPVNKDNKTMVFTLALPNLYQYEVIMTLIDASDDLIVNCYVRGIEGIHTVLLDPLAYFATSNTSIASKIRLQQVKQLSMLFKEKIAFPVKYSILKKNMIAFPCMEDMPTEVVEIIMKRMPLVDLIEFGHTNRKFQSMTEKLFRAIGKKMQ